MTPPSNLEIAPSPSHALTTILHLLIRKIKERCNAQVHLQEDYTIEIIQGTDAFFIELAVVPELASEGYCIEDIPSGVRICGQRERAVLYGIGRLLRDADYIDHRMTLGSWRGTSTPDKPLRGMYLATHFYNYYHCAPLDELAVYLEEIALWGANNIAVWFDMHHFSSIQDPQAQEMLQRLTHIFATVKSLDLMTTVMFLGNEAYADSPAHLRAETIKQGDYRAALSSHYKVELCPHKEGASALMLQWKREVLEYFAPVGVDYVSLAPYDQGGCTCSACEPWGGNGFIKVCKESAAMIRSLLPESKIIIFTWLFRHFLDGEWDRMAQALEEDSSWADILMWDFNTTSGQGTQFIFDPHIAQHGVPGNLPLIGFPEISMFATHPYGGWGSNPQPDYIQSIWDTAGELYQGGLPYSEGMYEDINKVVCLQLYWDRHRRADDILKEYIASEFSPAVIEPVFKAIKLMQSTYIRVVAYENGMPVPWLKPWGLKPRFIINNPTGVDETYHLMQEANAQLAPATQQEWRWRVLYLRSVIDYELIHNGDYISPRCEKALEELEVMYYAQNASFTTAPPTQNALKAFRPQ